MNLWNEYGSALYLPLLHANFLDQSIHRSTFTELFAKALACVPRDELATWIGTGWRERLTAGWIIAAKPDPTLRDQLTRRLLVSETCYAGQGLCIATARYCDHRAANDLEAYLRAYLPPGDREYDQEWAIGSLIWLDRRLGTDRAQTYPRTPDAWRLVAHGRAYGALDPTRQVGRVARAMDFLDGMAGGRLSSEG